MVPSALVKVPFAPHAPAMLLVARDLERDGIPVNLTSTFSARQAVAAAPAPAAMSTPPPVPSSASCCSRMRWTPPGSEQARDIVRGPSRHPALRRGAAGPAVRGGGLRRLLLRARCRRVGEDPGRKAARSGRADHETGRTRHPLQPDGRRAREGHAGGGLALPFAPPGFSLDVSAEVLEVGPDPVLEDPDPGAEPLQEPMWLEGELDGHPGASSGDRLERDLARVGPAAPTLPADALSRLACDNLSLPDHLVAQDIGLPQITPFVDLPGRAVAPPSSVEAAPAGTTNRTPGRPAPRCRRSSECDVPARCVLLIGP